MHDSCKPHIGVPARMQYFVPNDAVPQRDSDTASRGVLKSVMIWVPAAMW